MLISSNQTNRLKRSPVRQNPSIPARKQQHQHLEMRADVVEIAPRENERRGEEQPDERGDRGTDGVGAERDAENEVTRAEHARSPPPEPMDDRCPRLLRGPGDPARQRHDRQRRRQRDDVGDARRQDVRDRDQQRRHAERQQHRLREQQFRKRHRVGRSARTRCGSTVPVRFWTWIASTRSSADTAAPMTMSVSTSAWITGSTAGVPGG